MPDWIYFGGSRSSTEYLFSPSGIRYSLRCVDISQTSQVKDTRITLHIRDRNNNEKELEFDLLREAKDYVCWLESKTAHETGVKICANTVVEEGEEI